MPSLEEQGKSLLEQMGVHVQSETDLIHLHPDLRPYAHEIPNLGWSLRHPLVYMVAGVFCNHANSIYEHKRTELAEAEAEKNFSRYVWLHERPYRLDRLTDLWAMGRIQHTEFRELLTSVWTDTENPFVNQEQADLLDLFHDACAIGGTIFDHVPGGAWYNPWPQPVFRGTDQAEADAGEYGMSWTCNRGMAEWFANRLNDDPVLLIGQVPDRKKIFGYFAGRGEEEIVVNPSDVVLREVVQL